MDKSLLVAIGYARTSNASNPEASIPNQIETIEKYCKQNNMLLKQVYVDEKKSGMTTDKRIEYQKLKEIVLQGKVDVVVVSFSDRLARESYEFILMMEQMKRHGVDFISIQEALQGSRMTALETTMVGMKNEMENNARSKRVKDGKMRAIEIGKYPYSYPPFGYNINKEKELVINEEEGETVKWVYDAYEKGKSITEMTKYLKSTQALPNERWKMLGKILENSIYTGEGDLVPSLQKQYPNLKMKAPLIISKGQFERVQKIRETKKRKPSTLYLLTSGPFLCPNCKGDISAKKQDRKYYCTQGRIKKDKDCLKCEIDVLDKQVLTFLTDWIDSETKEVYKSDEGEELLRKKSQNELAFATGKIALKTFEMNSQKIIQQYKVMDSESFITPLSRVQMLKSLINEGELKGIKEYMKGHGIQLTFDSQKNVILFEET